MSSPATALPIFTIGHSTQAIEWFTGLLVKHRIQFVLDVRSTPYSRRVPQFNRPELRNQLSVKGVVYAHMSREFGARRSDRQLLDKEGKVDFDLVRTTEAFRAGIKRLKHGVNKGYRIALMCAEADPFQCHRFSMISYQLVREGLSVKHILQDGRLIDNSALEERLWLKYGRHLQKDMFSPISESLSPIDQAYRLHARDVAYTPFKGP